MKQLWGGASVGADQLLMARNFLHKRAEPQSQDRAAGTYSIYVNSWFSDICDCIPCNGLKMGTNALPDHSLRDGVSASTP